jgi:hypothetical protein
LKDDFKFKDIKEIRFRKMKLRTKLNSKLTLNSSLKLTDLDMWKLKDGSGYFVLHKRKKKGSNILVVTDKGLSNQASWKLIFYGKGMAKVLRSWDMRLPENMCLYLSEDSG